MALPSRPDFTLTSPNPNRSQIPDALWWFWLMFDRYIHPAVLLGGIYANKSGFHNTGAANQARWPGNYSLSPASKNMSGPWWSSKASAVDLTFPDAQAGNFTSIARYSKRLLDASRAGDERLTKYLHEWYGNADSDREVEGWSLNRGTAASSDDSHLWHIHLSFYRLTCGDFWAAWAVLTVLDGWTVAQWKASLPAVAGGGSDSGEGDMFEEQDRKKLDAVVKQLQSFLALDPTVVTDWSSVDPTGVRQLPASQEIVASRLRQEAILAAVTGGDNQAVLDAIQAGTDEVRAAVEAVAAADAARDAANTALVNEVLAELRNLAAGGATADEILDRLSERLRPAE